jgi:parvulin-like peptidyl-prolyl isomerase
MSGGIGLISARVSLCVLQAILLAPVGYSQVATSPANSSESSTAAAGKALPATERVILKVGDRQITQSEFESRIGDIEPQGDSDKAETSEKDRRRLGDDYASVLMLSQQALANHLDSTPEVSRQLAVGRLQILSDAEFASLMRQALPSSAEIDHYYAAHLPDYDAVHIRRLFIWKLGAKTKNGHGLSPEVAEARAKAILEASAAGRDTTKLTEMFRNSNVGLLDPEPLMFPRGELPAAMEKAAFGAKKGEWAQAQDTNDSIILVQLVDRDRRQVGQVSKLIEKELQGQKMQAILDHLKKNAGIWMDEQYFGAAVNALPGSQSRGSDAPSKQEESTRTGEIKP